MELLTNFVAPTNPKTTLFHDMKGFIMTNNVLSSYLFNAGWQTGYNGALLPPTGLEDDKKLTETRHFFILSPL